MTIERSHGRARPTLPRLSDVPTTGTAPERDEGRTADGRFGSGNAVARGRGWKRAIRKLLGHVGDDPLASNVAEHAWRLYAAFLRELPHDGPSVRALVAQRARHEALSGFWTDVAASLGMTTEAGIAATDRATAHGQRAERLSVTSLDTAVKLAAARKPIAETPLARIRAAMHTAPAEPPADAEDASTEPPPARLRLPTPDAS